MTIFEDQAYDHYKALSDADVSDEAIDMAGKGIAISLKRIADRLDRMHKSGLTVYDGNAI